MTGEAGWIGACRDFRARRDARSPRIGESSESAFRGGFLAYNSPRSSRFMPHWRMLRFGKWSLEIDKFVPVNVGVGTLYGSEGSAARVSSEYLCILLGEVFELCSGNSPAATANRLVDLLANGEERVLEFVAELSGRYLVLLWDGVGLRVYGDPTASRSCYLLRDSGSVTLSSHAALLSRVAGGLPATEAEWVLRHPEYIAEGGKSLPALVSLFDGVEELFANCMLDIRGSRVVHRRFYPVMELESISEEDSFERVLDSLRSGLANWIQSGGRPVLGLTGGQDSRAVLGAGLDLLQNSGGYAMTYHFFSDNHPSTRDDLLAANRLAAWANLPHLVVDVQPLDTLPEVAASYRATFPTWARFPSLVSSLGRSMPADSRLLLSIGGEVGTGFYRDRTVGQLSARLLARKYTYSTFQKDPRLIEMFETYLEYTQLSDATGLGYDFYDLFYWEHRLSKWAALGYAEYELVTSVGLPMNSRAFFRAMLALPYELRTSKTFYRRIAEESGVMAIDRTCGQ